MTRDEYLKQCAEHFDRVPEGEEVTFITVVLCREKEYDTLYHGDIMLPHLIQVGNSITSKINLVVARARKCKTSTVTFSN